MCVCLWRLFHVWDSQLPKKITFFLRAFQVRAVYMTLSAFVVCLPVLV